MKLAKVECQICKPNIGFTKKSSEFMIALTLQLEKTKLSILDQISGAIEYTGELKSTQIQEWGR
jgi:hypothetical protein